MDLDACLQGDKRAWDAFVDRWAGVIYAAVQRVLRGGHADVDDVVQDVFVRLIKDDYRLLRSYDPGRASLATWLTLVARSTAIDRLRRRRPPEPVPLDEHLDVPAGHTPPASASAEVPLHLLTARQRLVLRLLFDDDLSVAETARVIGVDEQTVRSTKHKALSRLREHLAESGGNGGDDDVVPRVQRGKR